MFSKGMFNSAQIGTEDGFLFLYGHAFSSNFEMHFLVVDISVLLIFNIIYAIAANFPLEMVHFDDDEFTIRGYVLKWYI